MNTQFETWWENEAPYSAATTKELCQIAWKKGEFCALNLEVCSDGDMDKLPQWFLPNNNAKVFVDDAFDRSEEPVLHNDSSEPEDDMDEPFGPACQLGDETCESCQ